MSNNSKVLSSHTSLNTDQLPLIDTFTNMAASQARLSLHARLVALGALNMGCTMIDSVFGFYYVKCFLEVYHIQEAWFQVAQAVYLIWNAVNDPLFAYLQDTTKTNITRTRRESVLHAAPLFAMSFLVPWFPWGDPDTMSSWMTGLHLITTLCLWDTMYTFVGLANSCLCTEISLDYTGRVKAVRYGQLGGLIGSLSVFVVQYISTGLENFRTFQALCILLAFLSWLLMKYCGEHAITERELKGMKSEKESEASIETSSYFTLTKQLLTNRDFLSFVCMNFFQQFHRTFLTGFLAIFCDQLIPKGDIPELARSVFYGGIFIVSRGLAISSIHIVNRYGYYRVLKSAFIVKIVMGLTFFLIGPTNSWMLMLFLLIDGCTADGTCSFLSLPASDVTDSDAKAYNRPQPITSMIYGTNAFIVKPAVSLSNMMVVAILNFSGYANLKRGTLNQDEKDALKSVMLNVMYLFPLIIGCIQTFTWSFYTIRSKT